MATDHPPQQTPTAEPTLAFRKFTKFKNHDTVDVW